MAQHTLMTPFLKFLSQNFRAQAGRYVPIDQSHNEYRHYGTQCLGELVLNAEEVLYMFEPGFSTNDKGVAMYVELKNSGFNLFRFRDRTDKYFVYAKTADFNRKKALPMATAEVVGKNDILVDRLDFFHQKPVLFCVSSRSQMSFLKVSELGRLSLAADKNMYKSTSCTKIRSPC
eukprot:jgi/Antlo1/1186/1092